MKNIRNFITGRSDFTTLLFLVDIIILSLISFNNELIFHFFAELTTIVISVSLFAILWTIRRKIDNGYFTVLGIGLVFIAILDALHIMTFEEINIIQINNYEHSLYFFIAARFLEGVTFLIAPICIGKRTNENLAGSAYSLVTAGMIYAIFNGRLPALIHANGEFSSFKNSLEIIILLIFFSALIFMYLKRTNFAKGIFQIIFLSISLAAISEVIIAVNTSQDHIVSVIGLILKIISYFFMFQLILVIGIEKPQDIFYHSLKENWEQLHDLIDNLSEGIGIIDLQDRFKFSNPAADRIFGLKTGGTIGKKIIDFIPESQQQIYLDHKSSNKKKNLTYEIDIIHPNKQKRTLIITSSPHMMNNDFLGVFIAFHDITKRKKEVAKLEEARRMFQTLFMDAPIRIWELDESKVKKEIEKLRQQGIEDFNTYLHQNLDMVKKLVGMIRINTYNKLVDSYYAIDNNRIESLTQIFLEESYYYFIEEILSVANNQTKKNYEMKTKTPSGDIRFSIVNWAVLPGHEQDYSRVIISADDVTERKKTEIDLKVSEEKFRQLAENADSGIGHVDLSGRIIFLNKKILELIDIHTDDYQKNDSEIIFGEDWGKIIKKRIKEISRSNKAVNYNDCINLPGGERWFFSNYTPIFNDQQKCNGVQIIFNDITNQKRLENELQSLARFPEENPYPVMRISKDNRVTYTNQSGQEILKVWGYDGKKQLTTEVREIVQSCLRDEQPKINEVQVNQNTISLYFTPIPDMDYVNIYGRDITELKRAETKLLEYSKGLEKNVAEKTKELVHAQEQLLRQEKLATMGQLASSVGHELRNPLAVINNSSYMLRLNDKKQDKTSQEYLDIIDQEIANANKIITDLLTFARIKPVDLNQIDIYSLIENVLKKFSQPENVKVTKKLAHNLPLVYIDIKQIEQVIANLITNAYQAIPVEGEVIIEGKEVDNQVRVDFIDNGIGIPKENMEKIFEPLFTTKAKGIGLGLTVSKMLAEINEGRIEVKSTVGKGSIFSLFLPVRNADERIEKH